MTDGLLGEFTQIEEESFEKILVELLKKENIEMKTDIENALNFTRLEVLGTLLHSEHLPDSAKLIDVFVLKYRVNRVSHKRQSRKEIIQALSQGLKEERNITDKLMSAPQKA